MKLTYTSFFETEETVELKPLSEVANGKELLELMTNPNPMTLLATLFSKSFNDSIEEEIFMEAAGTEYITVMNNWLIESNKDFSKKQAAKKAMDVSSDELKTKKKSLIEKMLGL